MSERIFPGNKVFSISRIPSIRVNTVVSINPIRTAIFSFSGARGVGKTTIVDGLLSRGTLNAVLPLVTTRLPRAGEENSPYYTFVSEKAFADMAASGSFISCETLGPGTYYGLSKSSVADALSKGGVFGIVSGFDIARYLKDYLTATPDVVVRTVLFKAPSLDIIGERIKGSGVDVANRLVEGKSQAGMIMSRETEFDMPVVNFEIRQTVESVASYIVDTRLNRTAVSQNPIRIEKTPEEIKLWVYSRKLWTDLKEGFKSAPWDSLEQIEQTMEQDLRPQLGLFFREMFQLERGRNPLDEEDEKWLRDVTVHTLAVYSASIQTQLPPEICARDQRRFGRLSLLGPEERASRNLSRIKGISSELSPAHNFYIMAYHDIGKAKDIVDHPEHGYREIKRYQLLDHVTDLTEEQKLEITLLSRNHVIFGCCATPEQSLLAFVDMFNDPEVQNLVRQGDGINLSALSLFLDRIVYLTCCDLSGVYGNKGLLRNALVERYFEIKDFVMSVMARHADNYDAAVDLLRREIPLHNIDRLATVLSTTDLEIDMKEPGLNRYKELIMREAQAAITEGVMSRDDWNYIIQNLHNLRLIFAEIVWCLAQIDPATNTVREGLDENLINPNVFKFISLIMRASSIEPGYGEKYDSQFRLMDSRGNILGVRRDKCMTEVPVLNEILNHNISGMSERDGILYLIDENGKELEDIQILVKSEGSQKMVIFKLLKI